MYKIKLSDMKKFEITEDKIREYAREVKEYANRQVMVEQTKDDPDPIKRWTNHPAPTAHPLIVNAVDANGEIKYEIEDDTPQVEQLSLELKKQNLYHQITMLEVTERNKIIPDGKIRLIDMHSNRISAADNVVRVKFITDAIQKKEKPTPNEIEIEVINQRKKDDQDFLDQLTIIKSRKEALDWWAAEQHSEIADLTLENIDSWKPAPLKV